jgi:hypothetical protein
LSHIPAVNRVLTAELTKWEKKALTTPAKDYQNIRDTYYESLFAMPGRKMVKTKIPIEDMKKYHLFWFELQQYEPYKWRMMNIEPAGLGYNYQYTILPTDIIDWMADTLVNPKHPVSVIKRSELLDKEVKLKFVRYSNTHIFGTVQECRPGESGLKKTETAETEPPKKARWEDDLENAFVAFHDYWGKFPEKTNEFIKKFIAGLSPGAMARLDKARANKARKTLKKLSKEMSEKLTQGKEVKVKIQKLDAVDITPAEFSNQPDNGQDADLYRLIKLSQLPEFNKLLKLKLAEIKDGILKEEVNRYEENKSDNLGLLYLCQLNRMEGKNLGPHWFILSKFKAGDWGLTRIYPWPPACEQHKQILPQSAVDTLGKTVIAPDRIMEISLDRQGPLLKKLDILFIHYSSTCVMGVVSEDLDAMENQTEEEKETRRLFMRMQYSTQLAKDFINGFMDVMKN